MLPTFSLIELADYLGAVLEIPKQTGDSEHFLNTRRISGISTLRKAQTHEISFFSNRIYRDDLRQTQAAAVILSAQDKVECPVCCLIMANPYLGYAKVAQLFHPTPRYPAGRHPSAIIDSRAEVAESATIGANVVIEAGACIGEQVYIGAGCVIGAGVEIANDCRLVANVTLCTGTRLGQRVIIHPGAVIGSDGFGLANDAGQWVKIPQLGGVIIEDDVEIGANTTIDKGALEDTWIGRGAKLDNQIQVAHNVHIGENTAIAGCVGIAGSTHIGKGCMIGGGVGISGHLQIADNVYVTGGSVVLQSITEAGLYSSGTPLQLNAQWHRNFIRFKQLDELHKRIQILEQLNKKKAE